MSVRAVTVFFPSQFVSSTHAGCVSAFFPFLKPVAVSAATQFSSRHWRRAMFSQLAPPKKAVYSLTGNASSPFHAEPAHPAHKIVPGWADSRHSVIISKCVKVKRRDSAGTRQRSDVLPKVFSVGIL